MSIKNQNKKPSFIRMHKKMDMQDIYENFESIYQNLTETEKEITINKKLKKLIENPFMFNHLSTNSKS